MPQTEMALEQSSNFRLYVAPMSKSLTAFERICNNRDRARSITHLTFLNRIPAFD